MWLFAFPSVIVSALLVLWLALRLASLLDNPSAWCIILPYDRRLFAPCSPCPALQISNCQCSQGVYCRSPKGQSPPVPGLLSPPLGFPFRHCQYTLYSYILQQHLEVLFGTKSYISWNSHGVGTFCPDPMGLYVQLPRGIITPFRTEKIKKDLLNSSFHDIVISTSTK